MLTSAEADILSNPDFFAYIQSLEAKGSAAAALSKIPFAGIGPAFVARQVQGRLKAKIKIPSWYANPRIAYPPAANLAQSSSEATALYKASLADGRAIADLCGGIGVDAFFMGAKARKLFYNEPNPDLASLAQHNLEVAGRQNPISSHTLAEQLEPDQFANALIYLDPSRRDSHGNRAWAWEQLVPDMAAMAWATSGSRPCIVKLPPGMDIAEATRHLPGMSAWHIVCFENEVKELLATTQVGKENTITIADTSWRGNPITLTFPYPPSTAQYSIFPALAKPGQYLYEPHAGILKAHLQDVQGATLVLKKLAQHTQLYTSDRLYADYLGKIYRIADRLTPSGTLPPLFYKEGVQISARNFGLDADQLRAKYKLKSGPAAHLYYTQDAGGYACFIVERVAL